MTRLTMIVLGFGILASSSALAAERTVTLTVQNMFCADCPFIVKKSLEAVPGVARATVSFKDKTATVIYDDGRADVKSLTEATTNAGYPSVPKS
jgi:periplasmic mercuric ion binding protein